MDKNIFKKGNIIILLIFLVLTWLVGISIYINKSDTTEIIFDKEKAVNIYPQAVLSVQNCERDGNKFFTMHEDPQIIISPPKVKISSILVEFAEPVPIDSSVRIYYAKNKKNLSEENSTFKLLPKGNSEVIINLPSDIYTTLRCDIDIFGEWYEIKGIYVSKAAVNNTLYITIIISICIFILWFIGIKSGVMEIFHDKITGLMISKESELTVEDTTTDKQTAAINEPIMINDKVTVKDNNTNNTIKKKNIIGNIIILLVLLVLTWLIGINIYFTNSTKEIKFDRKTAISLYPEAVLSIQNCEREGNKFFTLHNDPQINISPPKMKISSILVEVAESVSVDSSVKIYYAKKKENLSEENSAFKTLPKGNSEVIISMPSDIYTSLRCDIDIFGEWYEIKGIYASKAVKDNTLFVTSIISICIFILWIINVRTGIMNIFHNKTAKPVNIAKENKLEVKDTNTAKNVAIVNNIPTVNASTMNINTNIVKANNTNKMFFIAIFLLILLKLSLVMGNKMNPIVYAKHDDILMYSRAVSISNGEWLGSYNNLTLAKGAFFSIWLAFLNLLSIPMLIGNEMLYIVSCLFLIWCINDIVSNKKILFFIFAVLLFNPVTLGDHQINRVYRDGIFPSLIIIVFAGTIGMFIKKDETKKMLICSIMSGISLSAAWHTREDTFWVLPFVIVADIVIAIFLIIEKRYKNNIKKYIYLILPFIILFLVNLFISSVNNIKYGRFITNDYMSKDFQGAYGALTRVAHENFNYNNPVPEEVRMKIYQISPSFNELRPYLDEGPLDGWKDEGKKSFQWPLHDYYAWFMWALRDAVAACGYYKNPQKAKEYYERLAKEVNNACDTGLLPSRTGKRVTLASPFSKEYIAPTLKNIKKAALCVIKYEQIYYDKKYLFVDDETFSKVREMEFYLNQLSHCSRSLVVINGWAFDTSGDIDIKIFDNLNKQVNANIILNDSIDVYNHFDKKYKTALKARFSVNYVFNSKLDYYLNITNKSGEKIKLLINNELHGGSNSTNIISHIDNVSFYNKENNTKVERAKNIFSNFLLVIYRKTNPIITIIALLSLLILTFSTFYKLIKKTEIYYYKEVIILWGLLLAFFVRTVMIAYVSASSFPAIYLLYLSSSYPVMIIFNCMSICCLFSFIKKYIKIKK